MSSVNLTTNLLKMLTHHDDPVSYQLPVGEDRLDLNPLIGSNLTLDYLGEINCINCSRKTKTSFNQGHCFVCFKNLPSCDRCIVKPELCHFSQGTCRDEAWGRANCMQPHYVYLANSSSIKVGITRATQIPTRWMDQGATQAMPCFKVSSRLTSGLIEELFRGYVSDRTNWQQMLKRKAEDIDIKQNSTELIEKILAEIKLHKAISNDDYQVIDDPKEYVFNYPVLAYPEKIKAINFDKQSNYSGKLMGIKGQYLMFDTAVLNIRKFAGYLINIKK